MLLCYLIYFFIRTIPVPAKGWCFYILAYTVYRLEISLTMPTRTLEDQFLHRAQNPFIRWRSWLADRLATWQNSWLTLWRAALLAGYLSNCQAGGCTEWAAAWFADCLTSCWLTEWAAGDLPACLPAWLSGWLAGWLRAWLASWQPQLCPEPSPYAPPDLNWVKFVRHR